MSVGIRHPALMRQAHTEGACVMGEITEGMTRAEMEFVIYGMPLADWLAQRKPVYCDCHDECDKVIGHEMR